MEKYFCSTCGKEQTKVAFLDKDGFSWVLSWYCLDCDEGDSFEPPINWPEDIDDEFLEEEGFTIYE